MIPRNEQTVLQKIGGQEALSILDLLKTARNARGEVRRTLYAEARERTVVAYRESVRMRLN